MPAISWPLTAGVALLDHDAFGPEGSPLVGRAAHRDIDRIRVAAGAAPCLGEGKHDLLRCREQRRVELLAAAVGFRPRGETAGGGGEIVDALT